jgi:hypothetical protein
MIMRSIGSGDKRALRTPGDDRVSLIAEKFASGM